jgi:hypothetical protein
MVTTQPNAKTALSEQQIIEHAVPAHLMVLVMELCIKAGIEGRSDFMLELNRAAVGPLAGLDVFSVKRLATRIDEAATNLLRDLSPDDPVKALHVCAIFALVLADEGLLQDPRSQAVLVSLLLIEDAKAEHPAEPALVRLEEEQWRKEAKKMLHRARLLGLYLR